MRFEYSENKPIPQNLSDHINAELQSLPLFKQLESDQFLDAIESTLAPFKDFKTVIILGTGGSSLGGQTLYAISPKNGPELIFLDNIDATTFQQTLATITPGKTGFIAISKSGNTAETLLQLGLCLEFAKMNHLDVAKHFIIVSESKPNAIQEIAKTHSIPTLEHPDTIGGRFSIFTVVGSIPAILSGLDFRKLRHAARDYLSNHENALHGAVTQAHLAANDVNQSVMMVYVDALVPFSSWYCQLWGESVGKIDTNKVRRGTTPIRALGAVDQHSQLQLYLDGPRDKFITLITLKNQTKTNGFNHTYQHPALAPLNGKTMGDLMIAEQRATYETMKLNQCHVRLIEIDALDETVLGAMLAHFMLETIAMAYQLNVTPFDQPAVEQGKILALNYLAA